MGTGIFLLPELQGARCQRNISHPGMHTEKGRGDAPAPARYSPVSPRSMAGVVGGTSHGRANNAGAKIGEK